MKRKHFRRQVRSAKAGRVQRLRLEGPQSWAQRPGMDGRNCANPQTLEAGSCRHRAVTARKLYLSAKKAPEKQGPFWAHSSIPSPALVLQRPGDAGENSCRGSWERGRCFPLTGESSLDSASPLGSGTGEAKGQCQAKSTGMERGEEPSGVKGRGYVSQTSH